MKQKTKPYQNFWGKTKIGKDCRFGAFVDIGCDSIGDRCAIQAFVSIPPGWTIGNDVFIGPGARFANDRHPKARGEWELLKGEVGDGASIGMNASIGAGVKIGAGVIIGMGAVVLKDCIAGTYIGNPARPLDNKREEK